MGILPGRTATLGNVPVPVKRLMVDHLQLGMMVLMVARVWVCRSLLAPLYRVLAATTCRPQAHGSALRVQMSTGPTGPTATSALAGCLVPHEASHRHCPSRGRGWG